MVATPNERAELIRLGKIRGNPQETHFKHRMQTGGREREKRQRWATLTTAGGSSPTTSPSTVHTAWARDQGDFRINEKVKWSKTPNHPQNPSTLPPLTSLTRKLQNTWSRNWHGCRTKPTTVTNCQLFCQWVREPSTESQQWHRPGQDYWQRDLTNSHPLPPDTVSSSTEAFTTTDHTPGRNKPHVIKK